MANLTISVDDELIKRARVRAIEQGTSLSAKVREFLHGYVNEPHAGLAEQRAQATARLMAAMEAATPPAAPAPTAATAPRGRRRTLREDLYADDFRARDRQRVPPATPAKAGRGR
jgi:plasmid stability protein